MSGKYAARCSECHNPTRFEDHIGDGCPWPNCTGTYQPLDGDA